MKITFCNKCRNEIDRQIAEFGKKKRKPKGLRSEFGKNKKKIVRRNTWNG